MDVNRNVVLKKSQLRLRLKEDIIGIKTKKNLNTHLFHKQAFSLLFTFVHIEFSVRGVEQDKLVIICPLTEATNIKPEAYKHVSI